MPTVLGIVMSESPAILRPNNHTVSVDRNSQFPPGAVVRLPFLATVARAMGSSTGTAAARLAGLLHCAHAHARQRRIYMRLMREHGGWREATPHCVHHWGSVQGQTRRFEVLLELAGPRKLRGASVADVGCGCGDLLAFLRRNGATPREYVGYDIVPEMVAQAHARFGTTEPGVAFECRDLALRPTNRSFDFVLSSGIFAFGNDEFFRQMTAVSLGG